MTAPHSGPMVAARPVALELGGYVPVSQVSPAYANPGDTITVTVQLASPHSGAVTMSVSTDSPSMFSYLPTQFSIPAGTNVGSYQATFNMAAWGNITLSSTNAAGSLSSVVTVGDSLRRRVSQRGL